MRWTTFLEFLHEEKWLVHVHSQMIPLHAQSTSYTGTCLPEEILVVGKHSFITLYLPGQATKVFDLHSIPLCGLFVYHTPQTNKGGCSADQCQEKKVVSAMRCQD